MPAADAYSDLSTNASSHFDGDDPAWAVAAKQPSVPSSRDSNGTESGVANPTVAKRLLGASFVPFEPTTIDQTGLRPSQVEALVLKYLLNSGDTSGRDIARQIALPFGILQKLLQTLKTEQLVAYRGSNVVGDYLYELTPRGVERARSHAAQSTYFGAAPVPLHEYVTSVEAQSGRHHKPRLSDVKEAFKSMVLSERVQRQIGEAINLGLGFFLHGPPGNGKTTIAENVTQIFGEGIWIPRAIQAGGEIIRVFDPTKHEVIAWNGSSDLADRRVDSRWLFVKRPTIIVGGELRLESLEVITNEATRISEAPLQLKANGGTFVVDDFGRQRFNIEQLLNRLIIPLERRRDVLNLPSGRSFEIPFDLMMVFSTNLSPEKLVDEAFLRRVPFTILAADPTEKQFREVILRQADAMGLCCGDAAIDHLLDKHYRRVGRPMRFCHPRDILQQVHNACDFAGLPMEVTPENLDAAVYNCLAIRAER